MPRPEKEIVTLTDDEANAIIQSTMGAYGVKFEAIPDEMKAQAQIGLKGLVEGLQRMGWTIERPKL